MFFRTYIVSLIVAAVIVQTMIFLILLYFFFVSGPWNTLGLPEDFRPPQTLPRNHPQSIFIREEGKFGTRSIYNILWSCLSTIFACTWLAVHPNIPASGDSQWAILRRRVTIMGYILLIPEYVLFWAGRQYYGARYFTKKYEKKHTGWTRTHAFFLIMGGFTLHDGDKPIRVLEADEMEELSEAGKIKWPTITEEEIRDRSKGDYLSKTIVLCQTTWFIGQCIARGAYGIAVTELEVVTVAFATLTGVIYFFWWDKPLDVHCSIPLPLLEDHPNTVKDDVRKDDTGPQITFPPEISDQKIPEGVVNHNPFQSTSIQVNTSTSDPALTRMQRFREFRRCSCMKHGTLFGLGCVFTFSPLKRFINDMRDMANCETRGDKTLRLPTFYSPPIKINYENILFVFLICVSTCFGATHCIAWSFHYPTLQERWAWRISATLVSGLPISILAFWYSASVFHPVTDESIWMKLCFEFTESIATAMAIFYVFSRIALLILPFIALRALPLDAYVQLNWVSFIPHI